jgi:hypothetical protein
MVIAKALPSRGFARKTNPQRPPRQRDVFMLDDNAVYKHEVLQPAMSTAPTPPDAARSSAAAAEERIKRIASRRVAIATQRSGSF